MKVKNPDIAVLKACVRALDKSTSRTMLEANLRFLWDIYIANPPKEVLEHLVEKK